MLVENNSLHDMTEVRRQEIIDVLDYDKYLQLLRDAYEKNWRNKMPSGWSPDTGNITNSSDNNTSPSKYVNADLSTQIIDNYINDMVQLNTVEKSNDTTYHISIKDSQGNLITELNTYESIVDEIMRLTNKGN